jgi:hypothetical protein
MFKSREYLYPHAPDAAAPAWHACVTLSVPVVFLFGLLILFRRAAGAFDTSLPPTLLLATATLLVAWLAIVSDHWLEQPDRNSRARFTRDRMSVASAWASLALFAVGCSFPFARPIDWLVWPMTFAAAWFSPLILQQLRNQSDILQWFSPRRHATSAHVRINDEIPLQRLARYRSRDGAETVHAHLRAEFSAGERDASVFVAFCPPFDTLPTVDAFLTDDVAADVQITQALHHGAQIDIRLTAPTTSELTVNVELTASASPGARV